MKNLDYSGEFCSIFKAKGMLPNKISYFYHIFNAISSVDGIPILIFQDIIQLKLIKVYKLFGRLRLTHIFNVPVGGTVICTFKKIKYIFGINIFSCRKGGYVLHMYTCDGIQDCPNDDSDEMFCFCEDEFNGAEENNCMKLKTRHNVTHCTHNYFMNKKGTCIKYNFKLRTIENKLDVISTMKNEKTFSCNNGKILRISLLNDLIPDCGTESEDEPILLALKETLDQFHCEPWEIPCVRGHIHCFNFTNICVYKLNEENYLIPCRNGGHLENCGKFECNMMFKCPDSYCILWTYVCDGKWDCPFGEDEVYNGVCTEEIVCVDMFRCRNEYHKCISIGNVCDDKIDCLHHDDEMFCELKSLQCPVSCHCLIYAITCTDLSYNISQLHLSSSYVSVSIFKSKISSLYLFKHKLQNLNFIQLPGNSLISVCPVNFLKYLILFDAAYNNIMEIKQNCFSASKLIKSISLNNNQIVNLYKNAFHKLYQLIFLNLSSNKFTDLPSECFLNLQALKVLNLNNINFKNIRTNSLYSSNIKFVKNTDYKISCVSSAYSLFTSYLPQYISCSDILPGVSNESNVY